jgi:hypothetical protein
MLKVVHNYNHPKNVSSNYAFPKYLFGGYLFKHVRMDDKMVTLGLAGFKNEYNILVLFIFTRNRQLKTLHNVQSGLKD